jgi:hypothetical protein
MPVRWRNLMSDDAKIDQNIVLDVQQRAALQFAGARQEGVGYK